MLRLGPPKNKEKSVKTVLETGLSCCTEWILNCAQEMVTNSSLVMELASPAKSLPQSWSMMLRLGPPKNKEKRGEFFWRLDCLVVLSGFRTVYKRWVTYSWPLMESDSHRVFSSVFIWMLNLCPPNDRKKREKAVLETGLSEGILKCLQEIGG